MLFRFQQFQSKSIPVSSVTEILSYTAQGHIQIACRKFFEATHPDFASDDLVIHHPNQYAAESMKYWVAKGKGLIQHKPKSVSAPKQPIPTTDPTVLSAADEALLANMDLDILPHSSDEPKEEDMGVSDQKNDALGDDGSVTVTVSMSTSSTTVSTPPLAVITNNINTSTPPTPATDAPPSVSAQAPVAMITDS